LAIIAKLPSNSIRARVLIFFYPFAIIEKRIRCFVADLFTSYFCSAFEIKGKVNKASNRLKQFVRGSNEKVAKATKKANSTFFHMASNR
jgi:hypothetical protein